MIQSLATSASAALRAMSISSTLVKWVTLVSQLVFSAVIFHSLSKRCALQAQVAHRCSRVLLTPTIHSPVVMPLAAVATVRTKVQTLAIMTTTTLKSIQPLVWLSMTAWLTLGQVARAASARTIHAMSAIQPLLRCNGNRMIVWISIWMRSGLSEFSLKTAMT